MSELKENAQEITSHASTILALAAASFVPGFYFPPSNGSSGASYDALYEAAENMRKLQEALKDLMYKTAQFLQEKGAAITESDANEALRVLQESGFFG